MSETTPMPEDPSTRLTESSASAKTSFIRQALIGFTLGFIFWIAASQFTVGFIMHSAEDWTFLMCGLLGAWLATTRARRLGWYAYGFLLVAFLLFGYTPAVSWMTRGWTRSDPLQHAPAVVVLAADGNEGIEITERGQGRILHGYELIQQGWAPNLVVSRGGSETSWIPALKRQMAELKISFPLIQTPEVKNTHDEALAVAQIARERGWHDVILVTHPQHMRRAAGVFEKTGLHVIASPCVEWRYNVNDPNNMPSRITALREWLHELLGIWAYRRRGWMD